MTTSSTKVALITGAATGIGRAIAIRLAKDGIAVAINYVGNSSQADEVVKEINEAGGNAVGFQANVGVVSEIIGLFDAVIEKFGGIDIVVANAGIAKMGIPIAEVTEDDFDRINAVNYKEPILCCNKPPNMLETEVVSFKYPHQVHYILRQV